MIVTICGPSLEKPLIDVWDRRLSLKGHLVFKAPVYPEQEGYKLLEDDRLILNEVHLKKILSSEAILVVSRRIDLDDFTHNCIEFAKINSKKIYRINDESLQELLQ